ncbi:MAG: dipeptide epimerase [Melioribacteraceae bacterium]|nr:dipeptide epimerase [Melioribacteraceae bacterium]MCF8354556.1 dipeptide epimerase [Melioribacteraceae bacterium]MCF8394488.1 dipeptide epimerase [Melioribacteraceae bacterium]MCF8420102.1 dipeptide epimerase [Melioribacteraceae bacterium]
MKIVTKKYALHLKDKFRISKNSRTSTPVIFVELHHDGFTGYGEASLPPYLTETQNSVTDYVINSGLSEFKGSIDDIITKWNDFANGGKNNMAAKAAVDIALNDLKGKIERKNLSEYFGRSNDKKLISAYTIGIDDLNKIEDKIRAAIDQQIFKVKLGTDYDKAIIETVNKISGNPIFVDVNEGWKSKSQAVKMIDWLSKRNVALIEQPLPKEFTDEMIWLKTRSALPIIADESFQSIQNLESVSEQFHGINIKLMKCGGLTNAAKIIDKAKTKMQIMIGCMVESSLAVTAASYLARHASYLDLDGNMLISNDPFNGAVNNSGEIFLPEGDGVGVSPNHLYI